MHETDDRRTACDPWGMGQAASCEQALAGVLVAAAVSSFSRQQQRGLVA